MYNNPQLAALYQQTAAQDKKVFTDFVTGQDEVDHYPVPAATTIVLIDLKSNKMWFKATDASGVPCPLRYFDIKEKVVAPPVDGSLVTREEFSGLQNSVKTLSDDFKKLLKALTPEGGALK